MNPTFHDLFGYSPLVTARAPGRVNLIGEHTDNVPPAERTRGYELGAERHTGTWLDYVAGVTASLREHGHPVGGFNVRIQSTLPLGGGLSSSASLEVALLRALNGLFQLDLDNLAIARIAHRAETGLVGAPVGIMDQMAASIASETRALFLDARTLAFEQLPLPDGCGLIVIHSGTTHAHAAGEYRVRRAQCDDAARLLGVKGLRDVSVAMLPDADVPPPLDRRVRHVVTENERVLHARDALRHSNAADLGRLMNESHDSMRDDFEVSTPDIDALVELAQADPGVFGARLTGGGFGGSIVALAKRDAAASSAQAIAAAYAEQMVSRPTVLIP
jgi:galactokinase